MANRLALAALLAAIISGCGGGPSKEQANLRNLPPAFRNAIPSEMHDGLRLVALEWRPGQDPQNAKPWRTVEFYKTGTNEVLKTERISIASGYRAMYSYPDTEYFANVRIEQSVSGSYDTDKNKVIDYITYLYDSQSTLLSERLRNNPELKAQIDKVKARGKEYFTFERGNYSNFEYISYTANVIGLTGGTISHIHIFIPKNDIILTAYLLSQKKAKFATIEEFLRLKQQFLEGYIEYLAKNN